MGGGIHGVYKLPGQEAVGDLLTQFLRPGDGAAHALPARGEFQLGAVGLHQLAAFLAHGIRHNDDGSVPSGRRHGGKADAGIPGGGLNNDGIRLQQPLFLGIVQHGLCHPVLYRACGVQIFQLQQKPCLKPQQPLQMNRLQQRSVSN